VAKNDIRLGLIGAGHWGRTYISAIEQIDGMRLSRLATTNPESRSLVADSCIISEDWHEVAEARDIDGVIIATPPHLHAEMTETAVTFGRPVLVEKPLTMDLGQAVELRKYVDLYDGFVMVEHTHLLHPAYQALKEFSGALGPVKAIRTEAGNRGPYRKDTPVIWDWGAHDVAMCLDLIGGMPEDVRAVQLETKEIEGAKAENLLLSLTFAGGTEAEIRIGNLMDKARRFEACFEKAVLVYDGLSETPLTVHPPVSGPDTTLAPGEAIDVAGDAPLDVALKTFCSSILNGDSVLNSLDLGVAVVSVLADCEAKLAS